MIKYKLFDYSLNDFILVPEHLLEKTVSRLRNELLIIEKARFIISASKTDIDGTTLWFSLDSELVNEADTFHAFNHVTGKYEPYATLEAAENRIKELKDEFSHGIYSPPYEIVTGPLTKIGEVP